jgi:hypothetical protein
MRLLRRRRVWLTACAVATILVLEGVASVLVAVGGAGEEPRVAMASCRFDPELGWTTLENAVQEGERARCVVTTGPDGVRLAHREPPASSEPYRICFLGDSFVFGYLVGDRETLPARIEQLEPRIEAVNLGVNGHGLDQCWLHWKAIEARWDCDMVAVGLIAHDLYRMRLEVFSGLEKPVLEWNAGELVATGYPLADRTGGPVRGEIAGFFDRLCVGRATRTLTRVLRIALPPANLADRPAADAVDPACGEVARAVLRAFHASAEARGRAFAVFYMPRGGQLASEPTVAARWLDRVTREEAIPYCDLSSAFLELAPDKVGRHFTRDTHFTARGQALAARVLLERLREQVPEVPR